MRTEHPIRYLRDQEAGLELIFCRDSSISYPLHNHASVFTVGLVLRGCVFLTAGGRSSVREKGDSFTVPPYVPHSLEARRPYSLLTLCVDKNILCKYSKDGIENNIRHLLAVCGSECTEAQASRLLRVVDSLGRALPSTNAARGIPRQCLLLLSGVFKKIVFNN